MAGLAALLLAAATAVAQDEDKIHVKVARKVIPAVVFVEGAGQRGSGVIIDAEGQGTDARVQVNFGNQGVKWLAVSVAKLQAA